MARRFASGVFRKTAVFKKLSPCLHLLKGAGRQKSRPDGRL